MDPEPASLQARSDGDAERGGDPVARAGPVSALPDDATTLLSPRAVAVSGGVRAAPPDAFDPSGPVRPARREGQGVEANARLTGSLAAVLLVLLFAEGLTILRIGALLRLHVFIGMLLVPPVALKVGNTFWRFLKYYRGDRAYRAKGPPPLLLRLLGPLVVVSTATVLVSGIVLLFVPGIWRSRLLLVHKASFVLWFGAMTVHVLGHVLDTARLAPADYVARTRRQVHGAGLRQWALAAALVLGVVLGLLMLGPLQHWLHPDRVALVVRR